MSTDPKKNKVSWTCPGCLQRYSITEGTELELCPTCVKARTAKSRVVVAEQHPKIVDALSPNDRLYLAGLMYRGFRLGHFLFCLPVAIGLMPFFGAGVLVLLYMWLVNCWLDWCQPDKPSDI